MSAGFVTGGHDRDELVEEVAQCHDVRVSGHGAADALDGQASGPSQRWKAASMRPHSTPTSQPFDRVWNAQCPDGAAPKPVASVPGLRNGGAT